MNIPIRNNFIDYAQLEFEALSRKIDRIPGDFREINKINYLLNSDGYISFLSNLTNKSKHAIRSILSEIQEGFFSPQEINSFIELEAMSNVGDLRFHSVSLYVIVRSLVPSKVLETGVAHGKSSFFILKALKRNNKGLLISIDKPPSNFALDGSNTSLHGHMAGWLVSDELRDIWTLIEGDSVQEMKKLNISGELKDLEVFFHDSLHTYEHAISELELLPTSNLTILMDNIDMPCGEAIYKKYTRDRDLNVHQYRDFGGLVLN